LRTPAIPVLVLGRSGDADAVRAALAAGARGYLSLEAAADGDLIQAVRSVATGELYLSPELAASHAAAPATPARPNASTARLTERETQVLTLVARGRSNREIAGMLGLSANTDRRPSRQPDEDARGAEDGCARAVRGQARSGYGGLTWP
jgi:DNA-binding NarL/FixJ family response regulator